MPGFNKAPREQDTGDMTRGCWIAHQYGYLCQDLLGLREDLVRHPLWPHNSQAYIPACMRRLSITQSSILVLRRLILIVCLVF
jgi:hypothetical protein